MDTLYNIWLYMFETLQTDNGACKLKTVLWWSELREPDPNIITGDEFILPVV